MIAGTVIGVEIGATIIEILEKTGSIDLVIGMTYIVILLLISGFTAWESIRAIRILGRDEQMNVKDVMGFSGYVQRFRRYGWNAAGIVADQHAHCPTFALGGALSVTNWRCGELKVRHGIVSEEIICEAEEGRYDLIVIGARTEISLLNDLLMEKVTPHIVEHAPSSVLVVRDK